MFLIRYTQENQGKYSSTGKKIFITAVDETLEKAPKLAKPDLSKMQYDLNSRLAL